MLFEKHRASTVAYAAMPEAAGKATREVISRGFLVPLQHLMDSKQQQLKELVEQTKPQVCNCHACSIIHPEDPV